MHRIDLHDVPETWFAADFNHRLRYTLSFFGNACPEPPSENDRFHRCLLINGFQIARHSLAPRLRLFEDHPCALSSSICVSSKVPAAWAVTTCSCGVALAMDHPRSTISSNFTSPC